MVVGGWRVTSDDDGGQGIGPGFLYAPDRIDPGLFVAR